MPSLATPPDLLPKLRRATCRVVTPTGAGAGTVVGRDRRQLFAAGAFLFAATVFGYLTASRLAG